jgi:hypothetical protein
VLELTAGSSGRISAYLDEATIDLRGTLGAVLLKTPA